jgi:hypothetical protein
VFQMKWYLVISEKIKMETTPLHQISDIILTELYKILNTRFETERNTWGLFL